MRKLKDVLLTAVAVTFCGLFLLFAYAMLSGIPLPWYLAVGGLVGLVVWVGLVSS
jgi:hypothetical protein